MLGNATDVVMDNNDNIYILDANKRKIIKLDAVTNTPETYHDINADFDWQYESDESSPYNNRHFKNTEFIPMKLAYSSDSNKRASSEK